MVQQTLVDDSHGSVFASLFCGYHYWTRDAAWTLHLHIVLETFLEIYSMAHIRMDRWGMGILHFPKRRVRNILELKRNLITFNYV